MADEGKIIAKHARKLTLPELQEMFAVAHTSAMLGVGYASLIMSSHFARGRPCRVLMDRGLTQIRPSKIGPRTHHRQRVTRFGMLVLFARIASQLPLLESVDDETSD